MEAGNIPSTMKAKSEAAEQGRNPQDKEVAPRLDREAAAATTPSELVASEAETDEGEPEPVRRDGLNIFAAGFVPGRNELDTEATVRPRRPCNFSEEGDEHEMHDGYQECQRGEEEEMARQHRVSGCVDDQLMADAAQAASEEAKASLKHRDADLPDFIKVKRKGKGEASRWYECTKPGMICEKCSQCIGYYKDGRHRLCASRGRYGTWTTVLP